MRNDESTWLAVRSSQSLSSRQVSRSASTTSMGVARTSLSLGLDLPQEQVFYIYIPKEPLTRPQHDQSSKNQRPHARGLEGHQMSMSVKELLALLAHQWQWRPASFLVISALTDNVSKVSHLFNYLFWFQAADSQSSSSLPLHHPVGRSLFVIMAVPTSHRDA